MDARVKPGHDDQKLMKRHTHSRYARTLRRIDPAGY